MIATVRVIAEFLLQLLGFLLAEKEKRDSAAQQVEAQEERNEIETNPSEWFNKHFNAKRVPGFSTDGKSKNADADQAQS